MSKDMKKNILLFFVTLVFSQLMVACTEIEMRQISQQVMTGLAASQTEPLSLVDIDAGLREALRVGCERAVGRVGRVDGFYGDAGIRIPLPDTLEKVRSLAQKVGMDGTLTDLEERLNRAAEKAAPLAKDLFWAAILEMSIADARDILDGPDDAATRYFQNSMTPELARVMRPVVDESLDQVGAVRAFKSLAGEIGALPFAPRIETDLSGYVVEKGMAGIFHYLAGEEAAIRQNPAKRSTEILRRVFAANQQD